jgi:hypothetical protein
MDQLYWVLNQKGEHGIAPAAADDPNALAGRYALPPTPVTVEFQVAGREKQIYAWEGVLSRYEGSGIDPQSRTVPCRVRVEKPYQYSMDGKPRSDDRVSGPPALVRGMFVNLKVHTRPQSDLMLVPKMAVKPGNVVWRFEMTDEVLKSLPAPAADDVATTNATGITEETGSETEATAAAKPETKDAVKEDDFRPEDWAPGRMLVLSDLQVIRPYTLTALENGKSEDYWICEVIPNTLKSGDWVVITPMAAVKGDGTDAVRVYSRSVTGQPQPSFPPKTSQPAQTTAGKPETKDAS